MSTFVKLLIHLRRSTVLYVRTWSGDGWPPEAILRQVGMPENEACEGLGLTATVLHDDHLGVQRETDTLAASKRERSAVTLLTLSQAHHQSRLRLPPSTTACTIRELLMTITHLSLSSKKPLRQEKAAISRT